MVDCACQNNTVTPLIVPANSLSNNNSTVVVPTPTIINNNTTTNVTQVSNVTATTTNTTTVPAPVVAPVVVLGPLFVDTGAVPTAWQLHKAFNITHRYWARLEAAFRNATGGANSTLSNETLSEIDKVIVKGVAKVINSFHSNASLPEVVRGFAKAAIHHILLWVRRSDLTGTGTPIIRLLDREIKSFYRLAVSLRHLVKQRPPSQVGRVFINLPNFNFSVPVPVKFNDAMRQAVSAKMDKVSDAVRNATLWDAPTLEAQTKAILAIAKAAEFRGLLVYYTTYANSIRPVERLRVAANHAHMAGVKATLATLRGELRFLKGSVNGTVTTVYVARHAREVRPLATELLEAYKNMVNGIRRYKVAKAHQAAREKADAIAAENTKAKRKAAKIRERQDKVERKQKDKVARIAEVNRQNKLWKETTQEQARKDAPQNAVRRAAEIARKADRRARINARHRDRLRRQAIRDRNRKLRRAQRIKAEKDRKTYHQKESQFKAARTIKRNKQFADWQKSVDARREALHQRVLKKGEQIRADYKRRVAAHTAHFNRVNATLTAKLNKWIVREQNLLAKRAAEWKKLKADTIASNDKGANKLAKKIVEKHQAIELKANIAAGEKYNSTYEQVYYTTQGNESQRKDAALKAAQAAAAKERDSVLAIEMNQYHAYVAELRSMQAANVTSNWKTAKQEFAAANAETAKFLATVKRHQAEHKARIQRAYKRLQDLLVKEKIDRDQAIAHLHNFRDARKRALVMRMEKNRVKFDQLLARDALRDKTAANKRWHMLYRERKVKWTRLREDESKRTKQYETMRHKDQELHRKHLIVWNQQLAHAKKLWSEKKTKSAKRRAARQARREKRRQARESFKKTKKQERDVKREKKRAFKHAQREQRRAQLREHIDEMRHKHQVHNDKQRALRAKIRARRRERIGKRKARRAAKAKAIRKARKERRSKLAKQRVLARIAREKRRVKMRLQIERLTKEDAKRWAALSAADKEYWKRHQAIRRADMMMMRRDFEAIWRREKPKLVKMWNKLLRKESAHGLPAKQIARLLKAQAKASQEIADRFSRQWLDIVRAYRKFKYDTDASYKKQLGQLNVHVAGAWQKNLLAMKREKVAMEKKLAAYNLRQQLLFQRQEAHKLKLRAERRRKYYRAKWRVHHGKGTRADRKLVRKVKAIRAKKGQAAGAGKVTGSLVNKKSRKTHNKKKFNKKFNKKKKRVSKKALRRRRERARKSRARARRAKRRADERRRKHKRNAAKKARAAARAKARAWRRTQRRKKAVERRRKRTLSAKARAKARQARRRARLAAQRKRRESRGKRRAARREKGQKRRKNRVVRRERRTKRRAAHRKRKEHRRKASERKRKAAQKRRVERRKKRAVKAAALKKAWTAKLEGFRRKIALARQNAQKRYLEQVRLAKQIPDAKQRKAALARARRQFKKVQKKLNRKSRRVSRKLKKKLSRKLRAGGGRRRRHRGRGRGRARGRGRRGRGRLASARRRRHRRRCLKRRRALAKRRRAMKRHRRAMEKRRRALEKARRKLRRHLARLHKKIDKKSRFTHIQHEADDDPFTPGVMNRLSASWRRYSRHRNRRQLERRNKRDKRRKRRAAKRLRPKLAKKYRRAVYHRKWTAFRAARRRYRVAVKAYRRSMRVLHGKRRVAAKKRFNKSRVHFVRTWKSYSRYYHARKIAVLRYRRAVKAWKAKYGY